MRRYLNYLSCYMENKSLNYLSREQLLNLQLKRFRKLVRYALNHSQFYRDLYRQANITLQDVDNLYPNNVPIVTKKMLMDNFDDVVTDKQLKYKKLTQFLENSRDCAEIYQQKYFIIHTSGTTGHSGIYPFSAEEYDTMRVFSLIHIVKLTLGNLFKHMMNKHKYAFIGAIQGHFAGVTVVSTLPRSLYELQTYSILSPITEVIDLLNAFQPDSLTGYSSSIRQLAEEQLAGRLRIKPKRIFSGGDSLYPSIHSLIKNAFGISPTNIYSCTEAPNLGWQAVDTNIDEFLLADHLYQVDLTHNKMCLSNLYLYTFPIIHYQTDDVIEFIHTDYQISPFSKVKLKNTRVLDYIKIINNQGDSDTIHPFALASLFTEGLELIQFWQKPNNTILVKVKGSGDGLTERVRNQMYKILQSQKAEKVVHLEIEQVNEIPIDSKTGKFKVINAA